MNDSPIISQPYLEDLIFLTDYTSYVLSKADFEISPSVQEGFVKSLKIWKEKDSPLDRMEIIISALPILDQISLRLPTSRLNVSNEAILQENLLKKNIESLISLLFLKLEFEYEIAPERWDYYNQISGLKSLVNDLDDIGPEISEYGNKMMLWIKGKLEKFKVPLPLGIAVTKKRINGKRSNSEIASYFMEKFLEKQKNNKPILTEEQIRHFLHANFEDFDPPMEIRKFDTPKRSAATIRRIVYQFHLQHNPKNSTKQYIDLLKDNFSCFDNGEWETLRKTFSS